MSHFFGIDGASWYNFYSGVFGVLIFGGGLLWNGWVNARRHNCHVRSCWRLGRFPAGEYQVCRRHLPGPHPDARTVSERYHLYLGGKPGKG